MHKCDFHFVILMYYMHKKDGKEVHQNVFKVRFSPSDRKMGVIFSLHFPIISKYFFFFCTLSDKNSCYFFLKCTQSKSIRKTKFGASQFSPLGKARGMGEQSWGGFSSWCGMCAPCLEGGQGSSSGVRRRGVEREEKEMMKKAPGP